MTGARRLSVAAYLDRRVLESVTEADFQQQVIDLARLCGWRAHYVRESRGSPHGWPDLVLCRPPRLIFAELKVESVTKGKLTPDQIAWLEELHLCGVATYVWRPSNWDHIVEVLARTLGDLQP